MVTLNDLDTIVPEVIRQLNKIAEDMSRYKKIDTDLRARALINEIKGKVKQIKLAYETYKRPDMKAAYANKDFTEYVKMIQAYVPEYEKVYKRIKKFENITDYYADSPFKDKPEEPAGNQPGE